MSIDRIPEILKKTLLWAPIGPDKVAKHAHDPKYNAKVNDPSTWGDFPTVRAKVNGDPTIAGRLNGEVIVIDLDGTEVLPPDSLVKQKHHEVLKRAYQAGHYIEHSQSGKGYHIVFQGTLPFDGRKSTAHQVEIYTAKRYFAFTGNIPRWGDGGYPADVKPDETGVVNELVEFFEARSFDAENVEWREDPRSVDLIIKSMLSGNGNPDGRSAWQSGYPANCDPSQVDAQIAEMIVHATHDFEKARVIFKMGEQWDATRELKKEKGRHRQSYVDLTIERIGSQVLARHKVKVEQAQVQVAATQAAIQEIKETPVEQTEIMPAEYGALTALYNHCTYNPYIRFPEAALATSLSHIATIVGHAYLTPFRDDGINIYTAVVAHSGWGKDTAVGAARDIFREANNEYEPDLEDRLSPQFGSKQQMQSKMVENPTMLLWSHEFGKVLNHALSKGGNKFQSEIMTFQTTAYTESKKGGRIDAHEVRDQDKSVDVVERPCLSIIGDATPQDFHGVDPNNFATGTTSRYLYFTTETRPQKNRQDFIDYHAKEHVRHLFDQVKELETRHVGITSDARQWYYDQDDKTDAIYDKVLETDHVYAACLKRFMQQLVKVASIGAICRDPLNPVVHVRDLEWAFNIVRNCMQNVRRLLATDVGEQENNDGFLVNRMKELIWKWCTTDFRFRDPKNYSAFSERSDVLPRGYLVNSLSPKQRKDLRPVNRAIKELLDQSILQNYDPKIHGELKPSEDVVVIGVTGQKSEFDPNVKRFFVSDLNACQL
ncbi:hypothetical protein [Ruegeria sp. HKCCD7318]|uniref:hypothetical protein n=1 Tax=Ruegeria sp. HKCCD7318 TaxID=2683014 RepID=UPI001490D3DC|nr:hypothetical protein [Ruegeria sp. HKCCD7318]NOE32315.1 hypothetical protein [Ruegeria sp. HKCCD7318]